MKKLLTALIWLMVLTSLFAHPVAETVAEETSEAKVGDVTEGFVVTDTGRFDPIGADIVLYEHIKTGAQVLLLLNEDTNRAFEITFRTPTHDAILAEEGAALPQVMKEWTERTRAEKEAKFGASSIDKRGKPVAELIG